jgi:hypothetical protein
MTDRLKTIFRFSNGFVPNTTYVGEADGTMLYAQGLWVRNNGLVETWSGLNNFGEQAPITALTGPFTFTAPNQLQVPAGGAQIYEQGQWLLIDGNVVPVHRVLSDTLIQLADIPLFEPVSANPSVSLLPVVTEVDDFRCNFSRGSVRRYLSGTLVGVGHGGVWLGGAQVRTAGGTQLVLKNRLQIAVPANTTDFSIYNFYDAGLPGFWPIDPIVTDPSFTGTFTVTLGTDGKMPAGRYSMRLTRIRKETGGESNPTDPIEFTVSANGSVTINAADWPKPWPGQTAWGVFMTPEPLPADSTDKPGPWYRWPFEDIPVGGTGTQALPGGNPGFALIGGPVSVNAADYGWLRYGMDDNGFQIYAKDGDLALGTADYFWENYFPALNFGIFQARVTAANGGSANAHLGLIIRAPVAGANTITDPYVYIGYQYQQSKIIFSHRPPPGGGAATDLIIPLTTPLTFPFFLRIIAEGGSTKAFYSQNGVTWTQAGSDTGFNLGAGAGTWYYGWTAVPMITPPVASGSPLMNGYFDQFVYPPDPTTASTTTATRKFSWISQELEGSDLLEFDNDPPPDASFLAVLDDIILLCSTEGRPDPVTGLPTSPGPGIRPSKPLNPEAYPAAAGTLVGPPEDIIGVLEGVGRVYIGTRNRIHIATLTGNNAAPIQVRPFWTAGITNPQQIVFVNGELYGYTGFGPTRSAGDGAVGSEEHTFGARVQNVTRNWVRERVRVGYDPVNRAVVYFHTQDQKSVITLPDGSVSEPIWKTMALPFMLDTQVWSGLMFIHDPLGLDDFHVSGVATVDGELFSAVHGYNQLWDGGDFGGLLGYGFLTPSVDAGQPGLFKTLIGMSLSSLAQRQFLFVFQNNRVSGIAPGINLEPEAKFFPEDSPVVMTHPWYKLNVRHSKTFFIQWAGFWGPSGLPYQVNEIVVDSILERAHH